MPAGISIVTLGVADIARSTRFYVELGWTNTPASQESISFLQGHNIVLALYSRAALAEDAMQEDRPTGFSAMTLAVNVESPQAADTWFSAAIASGGKALKSPHKVFWGGYSGYFADPDGHLWEIAHNPFAPMDSNGRIDLLTGAPS